MTAEVKPMTRNAETKPADTTNAFALQSLNMNLATAKSNKEQELANDEREMQAIHERMKKRQRELYVIDGKQRAVRAAIRTLEDLGITE